MNERARRKDLRAQYKQRELKAGVYRIVNLRNNKGLLGSSPNLAGLRNKMDFAKTSNMSRALDLRLSKDIREFGIDAFA